MLWLYILKLDGAAVQISAGAFPCGVYSLPEEFACFLQVVHFPSKNSNDSFHVLERALLQRQPQWSSFRKMNPGFYTYKYSVARLHLMNPCFDHLLQNVPKRPFICSLRASCCARMMLMLPIVHILICTHVQSFKHTRSIFSSSQMHVLTQLISQLIHNQMWHFLSIHPPHIPHPLSTYPRSAFTSQNISLLNSRLPVSPRLIRVVLQHCYLSVMVGFSCLLSVCGNTNCCCCCYWATGK